MSDTRECPFCAEIIKAKAIKCKYCGSMLNEQSFPQRPPISERREQQKDIPEQVNIVCPNCNNRNTIDINKNYSLTTIICSKCKTSFQSKIVKVKSKQSEVEGKKKDNKRRYSIRGQYLSGEEELIEFSGPYLSDSQFRVGDVIVLTYWKSNLYLLQNITINKIVRFIGNKSNCGCMTCLIICLIPLFFAIASVAIGFIPFLIIICLIIGYFKPDLVIFWKTEKKTRETVLKYYGTGALLSLILISCVMLDKAKKSINQENTSTITLPQSTPMQKPTLKPTEKPTFAPNPTKIPLSIVEFRLGDKGHLDCGEKNCLLAVTEKEYYEVLQQVNKTKDGVKLAELILNKKVIQIKNNPEVKILANEEDLLIKCGIQEGDYQFSIVYVSKESIIPAD